MIFLSHGEDVILLVVGLQEDGGRLLELVKVVDGVVGFIPVQRFGRSLNGCGFIFLQLLAHLCENRIKFMSVLLDKQIIFASFLLFYFGSEEILDVGRVANVVGNISQNILILFLIHVVFILKRGGIKIRFSLFHLWRFLWFAVAVDADGYLRKIFHIVVLFNTFLALLLLLFLVSFRLN